jgi:hypothetical protein
MIKKPSSKKFRRVKECPEGCCPVRGNWDKYYKEFKEKLKRGQ